MELIGCVIAVVLVIYFLYKFSDPIEKVVEDVNNSVTANVTRNGVKNYRRQYEALKAIRQIRKQNGNKSIEDMYREAFGGEFDEDEEEKK